MLKHAFRFLGRRQISVSLGQISDAQENQFPAVYSSNQQEFVEVATLYQIQREIDVYSLLQRLQVLLQLPTTQTFFYRVLH